MTRPGHWLQRPEASNRFWMWLIRSIGLHLGRGAARALLYPISAYFYLRRGPERRAAREFFRHLEGRRGSHWRSLRLFHANSATILDRLFLLARGSRGFDISMHGVDALRAQLARGQGVLLVGAHIGSFDVLRVCAAEVPDCKLKLVMDTGKTPVLTTMLEALAPELADNIIDTSRGGVDIVLALTDALRDGAMATMLADRGRPHERMRAVPFLDAPALFPAAPWLIAALLGVPVVLCLGLYRGGKRYDLVFETLAERVELPRARREQALDTHIARYAARLEYHLRQAPLNWFNFYDFWQAADVVESSSAHPDASEPAHAQ